MTLSMARGNSPDCNLIGIPSQQSVKQLLTAVSLPVELGCLSEDTQRELGLGMRPSTLDGARRGLGHSWGCSRTGDLGTWLQMSAHKTQIDPAGTILMHLHNRGSMLASQQAYRLIYSPCRNR